MLESECVRVRVREEKEIGGICGSLQKQGLCLSKAFMRCEMQLLRRCLSATIKFAKILFLLFQLKCAADEPPSY